MRLCPGTTDRPNGHTLRLLLLSALFTVCAAAFAPAQTAPAPAPAAGTLPVSLALLERSRTDAISFYGDAPYTSTYPYFEQLLRISLAQKIKHLDDQFVQLIDNPTKKIEVRSDLHFLQLASNADLWYQGGGAFDNEVFGYTGRPANLHSSFASTVDISSDYALTPAFNLNLYYARSMGKSVISSNFPVGPTSANYGYLELVVTSL